MNNKLLFVSGSPHVHHHDSVKKIMWSVVIALLPAFLVAVYYFGLPVIMITTVSIASCLFFEYLIQRFLIKGNSTLGDGSAVITGLLLAFNLPSNIPLWMVVIGALIAIGVGKMAFGGLGRNPFNPALVGRVFLLISFPVEMTSWPKPVPLWSFAADAITGPTPLGILSEEVKRGMTIEQLDMPTNIQLLFGQMGGSFGEVSAIALIVGALFLLIRKVITWHIPVAFIGSAFLFAAIFHRIDPTIYANPFFHIITGGLLLGALYMATDMVTSPTSAMGMLIFGIGCGIITMLIRMFGAYPEGVSFAILLMNAIVPLLNKAFKPKVFAQ